MDGTRFDVLTRKLSSRRTVLAGAVGGAVATLLRLATVGEDGAAAPACAPNQKRCGNRCIPKNACCPRTQKRCGSRCIAKRACCNVTHKQCGGACIPKAACCTVTHHICNGACIPKSVCCTNADCNPPGSAFPNYYFCHQGQCLVNQGMCAAGANICTTATAFCGDECACRQGKSSGQTRCAAIQTLSTACNSCNNDGECAASFPNVPGVFCAAGGSPNCSCPATSGVCVRPCPG